MINIIITLFIFLLLITQKILLLNEESLILLCFITFISLSFYNLGESVNSSLQEQSSQIKNTLSQSLQTLFVTLQQFSILHKSYKSTLKKFTSLKVHYYKLVALLARLVSTFGASYLNLSYNKKLNFLNKIEEQTIKLFIAVVLKKLNLIIKNRYFFISSIQISQFKCLDSILLRECIQLLNTKKI